MKERVIENTQRKYKQSSLWAGTEPKQEKRNQMLQNVVFTGILVAVFFLLIGLILPEGCFYGSTIDWYDQHVTLAETIRRTCMEEKTLAPAWMIIGGGNNGFQFAYYGYFRPDIILGCLLPQVPMTFLIPAYALCSYLAAVLLMRYWLRLEGMSPFGAFFGSMLFLLANCFFQTHRQIMFVNYLPFLLLALIFLKKRKFALMSVSLTLIYLHSFYYAIACLAVIGWFAVGMLRREADWAGKRKLLFQGVTSVILSIGMAMMLLLPTFMAILEHKHSGEKATTLTELVLPNAQNLLYSPYGMGLTVICLYLLLLGLTIREYRWQSALLLIGSLFGVAPYILNATLYARGKILVPFVPVVLLYCMKIFQKIRRGEVRWKFWIFLVFAGVIASQWGQAWFWWVTLDTGILLVAALVDTKLRKKQEVNGCSDIGCETGIVRYLFLFIMPFLIYVRLADGENWQGMPTSEAQEQNFTEEELQAICGNKLYRCNKLTDAKKECNALQFYGQQTTTMYSSVTNSAYQNFYYDLTKMPIQINNRTALLEERNPLFAQLMAERYVLTTENKIPYGYKIVAQQGKNVIAENPNVLPIAYTTSDCISDQQFEALGDTQKMTALSRYTVVEDASDSVSVSDMEQISLPALDSNEVECSDNVKVQAINNGYQMKVTDKGTIRIPLDSAMQNGTLYFRFRVNNHTEKPVVISANGRKNKLSGLSAPYPNENNCFSYMLKERGNDKYIMLRLSEGSYDITDVACYVFPGQLLADKQVEAAELVSEDQWEKNSVLKCNVTASEDEYFVTSIPMQNGLKLYVDGKETKIETVNTAFAGAKLSSGSHTIDLRFDPPGQKYGMMASLLSVVLFAIWSVATVLYRQKHHR